MRRLWILLFLTLALAGVPAGAADVLLLLTGPDAPASRITTIRRAMEKVLRKHSPLPETSWMRLPPSGDRHQQFDRIQELLRRNPGMMIAALDDTALQFLLRFHAQLPDDARMVFADCVYGRVFPQYLYSNMTGVLNGNSADELTRLGLRLFPGTRRILAVTSNTETGRIYAEQLARAKEELHFTDFRILTSRPGKPDELTTQVDALGDDALVVYCGFVAAAPDGNRLERPVGVGLDRAEPPLVTMDNRGMGRGTLLGYGVPPDEVGAALGDLVSRILEGAAPSEIPVRTLRPKVTVDPLQLRLRNIPVSRLPPEYVISGRNGDAVEEMREQIHRHTPLIVLGLSMLILFFGLLLFLLLRDQKRGREQHRLMDLFESLPVGFVLFTPQLKIEYRHGFESEGVSDEPVLKALENAREVIEEVLKSGQPHTLDLYVEGLRWAGELFRYDRGGEATDRGELLWVLQEISLRESRERIAENEAERLHGLLDSVGTALICLDSNRKITDLNEAAEELTGVSTAAAVGCPLDSALTLENLLTGARGGLEVLHRADRDYCAVRSPGGGRRVCRISSLPIELEEWRGELITVTDLTLEDRLRSRFLRRFTEKIRLLNLARLTFFRREVGALSPTFPEAVDGVPWGTAPDGGSIDADQWIRPGDLPEYLNLWDKLESRRIPEGELVYQAVNGRRYWLRASRVTPDEFSGVIADLGEG